MCLRILLQARKSPYPTPHSLPCHDQSCDNAGSAVPGLLRLSFHRCPQVRSHSHAKPECPHPKHLQRHSNIHLQRRVKLALLRPQVIQGAVHAPLLLPRLLVILCPA